jgi:hypothetical protein
VVAHREDIYDPRVAEGLEDGHFARERPSRSFFFTRGIDVKRFHRDFTTGRVVSGRTPRPFSNRRGSASPEHAAERDFGFESIARERRRRGSNDAEKVLFERMTARPFRILSVGRPFGIGFDVRRGLVRQSVR